MNVLQALIIEDDRDTAGFSKIVLELEGIECEIVLSAKEALTRLSAWTPDLILLDIILSGEISGEDILYQIRGNPRFDKTHVVITTAYPNLAEPITNLADLVLVKPIEISQLKSLKQRLNNPEFKSKSNIYRDPVTGFYNDDLFLTRLELAFERAKRRPKFHFAVIGFEAHLDPKLENQNKPEAILAIQREIASRLKVIIRPTDAVARLGDWKFATLHEDLNDPAEIQFIVKRLHEKLSKPYEIENLSHMVSFGFVPVKNVLQFRQPSDILKAILRALGEERGGG